MSLRAGVLCSPPAVLHKSFCTPTMPRGFPETVWRWPLKPVCRLRTWSLSNFIPRPQAKWAAASFYTKTRNNCVEHTLYEVIRYKRALELYAEQQRPVRVEIPFRETVIPGYLRLAPQPKRPLVILINGMDNLKEVENHYLANQLLDAGLNVFTFDGPGQGEMWKSMKFIPDYEKAVSAVIDRNNFV